MTTPVSRRDALISLAALAGTAAGARSAAAETLPASFRTSAGADDLYAYRGEVETRWATPENPGGARGQGGKEKGGRKGRPCISVARGERVVLAEAQSTSGVVRRMWTTFDDRRPQVLRGLKLEFFWDGAEQPAVAAPLGDFFGTGLGQQVPFQSAFFSNPEGRSFNCSIPMPFRRGMRIVLTNESSVDIKSLYYEINYTLGDPLPEGTLYFHVHWRRENPTQLQQDYEILPRVEGRGRYLGCNIGVIADQKRYGRAWWGEGEVKVYLDGDRELPTLCGTGTEDYIGTAWGQGQYDHLWQGCHFADREKMRYCFYRYHGQDPVWFHRDIRVTIHQIGCWSPDSVWDVSHSTPPLRHAAPGMPEVDWSKNKEAYGLFERADDWSSCSYFYLEKPDSGLPPLAPVALRVAGLES